MTVVLTPQHCIWTWLRLKKFAKSCDPRDVIHRNLVIRCQVWSSENNRGEYVVLCRPTACFGFCSAERSDNFIVGLTNVSPTLTAPTIGNYAVCGQYPGAVGAGAIVSLQCSCNMTAYRYLIVQFPMIGRANFCELEVFVRRKLSLLADQTYSVSGAAEGSKN